MRTIIRVVVNLTVAMLALSIAIKSVALVFPRILKGIINFFATILVVDPAIVFHVLQGALGRGPAANVTVKGPSIYHPCCSPAIKKDDC